MRLVERMMAAMNANADAIFRQAAPIPELPIDRLKWPERATVMAAMAPVMHARIRSMGMQRMASLVAMHIRLMLLAREEHQQVPSVDDTMSAIDTLDHATVSIDPAKLAAAASKGSRGTEHSAGVEKLLIVRIYQSKLANDAYDLQRKEYVHGTTGAMAVARRVMDALAKIELRTPDSSE